MKKAIFATMGLLFALLVVGATSAKAQTASFTFPGNTGALTELTTINGQPVNQATGWTGAIQTNGNFLLELPESLGFPNNGYLDACNPLTYGAKQWTVGNGTHPGDTYVLPVSTACTLWNGNVSVSFTETWQMVQRRYCGNGVCRTYLVATMQGGAGTATVE